MIRAIWLEDPARNLTFQVKPAAGIAYQGHEVTASPRVVEDPTPGWDGSTDVSQFLDSAAVTLDLLLYGQTRATLDALAVYCAPWARPYLVVDDDEWASPRQLMLRYDTSSHPVTAGTGTQRKCQYAWKAPAGVWIDTAVQVFEVGADIPDVTGLAITATKGIAITDAEGIRINPSTSHGSTLIPVTGTGRPRWAAKLYGPATGPKLSRDDIAADIVFKDTFTIPAGQYVEIIVPDMSANYLSQRDASRLSSVDFAATTWWPLDPQVTAQVRYHATSGTGPGSTAELTYVPVWIP